MEKIPVVVAGRTGRMSEMIASHLDAEPDMEVVGRLSYRPHTTATDGAGRPILGSLREVGDREVVVVDCTHPDYTRRLLAEACEVSASVVIGTSGLEETDVKRLRCVAQERAVLRAENFSLGLLAVARIVEQLGRFLSPSWKAEILDLHHAAKLDRPSATAKVLAARFGSERDGPEPAIASLRVGDGVSEHTVFLAGSGERIEIAHRLLDRRAFGSAVAGSVRFVHRRRAGFFTLDDVYPPDVGSRTGGTLDDSYTRD